MRSKSGGCVVQYYTKMEITEKWLKNNLTAEEESELRDSCKVASFLYLWGNHQKV
jgi:hypothetical protein